MSYCLWCETEIIFEPDWTTLFQPPEPKKICESCQQKLVVLEGNLCRSCGGKTSGAICTDCSYWARHSAYQHVLTFNRSVYSYNDTMKDMIARWKYRGDYQLVELFKQPINETFTAHFSFLKKEAVLVPIPLSAGRLKERAFNQAEALASILPYEIAPALMRTEGEKQSKKSRRERIESANPFFLAVPIQKPVILLDDIYTTGTTLRHAAFTLKKGGCPAVYAMTLARG